MKLVYTFKDHKIGQEVYLYNSDHSFNKVKIPIINITYSQVIVEGGMRFFKSGGLAVAKGNESYIEPI